MTSEKSVNEINATKDAIENGINVSKVEIKLMTEATKLFLSNGKITTEGKPSFTKGLTDTIDYPEDGLYSEKIFGMSMDSMQGKNKNFFGSYPDRSRNFGHIDLSVPFVHPDLCGNSGSALATLLGVGKPKKLSKIVNWEAILVRTSGNSDDLVMELLGESSKNQSIDTNASLLELYSTINTLDGEQGTQYNYWYVPRKLLTDIKSDDKYKKLGMLKNWVMAKNIDIFMGGYAVLHLLQQIDYSREIQSSLIMMKRIELNLKDKSLSDAKRETLEKSSRKFSDRYRMLIKLKREGTTWDAIVSNILLVMPAGLRDATVQRNPDGGVVQTRSEINGPYVRAIEASGKAATALKSDEFKVRNIIAKNDQDWIKRDIYHTVVIDAGKSIQNAINQLYTVEISSEVGKKYGKFRQTNLSKRADMTARGVITPDIELKLNEVGIPLYILKKWYKELTEETKLNKYMKKIEKNLVTIDNYLNSTSSDYLGNGKINFVPMSPSKTAFIDAIQKLETILSDKRVVVIRFPTLHKYNTMGYRMKIVFDNTIHLHPLVCPPYNADFDGDQMSPYQIQLGPGVKEVDEVLLPSKNFLTTSGEQLIAPTQDAILGAYYMTLQVDRLDNSNIDKLPHFNSYKEMKRSYDLGRIGLNDTILLDMPHYTESTYEEFYTNFRNKEDAMKNNRRYTGRTFIDMMENKEFELFDEVPVYNKAIDRKYPRKEIKTTVGRAIFNTILPQDLGYVNREVEPYELELNGLIGDNVALSSKTIKKYLAEIVQRKHEEESIYALDAVKDMGYNYATIVGLSMSVQDIHSHPKKQQIISDAQKKSDKVKDDEMHGLITRQEAYESNIAIWRKADDELTDITIEALPDDNTIKMMATSGSRGNTTQISQMMGMRGLMADTEGNTIETPITSSFEDGMSQAEYFVASTGARKGIYDRSNRTKDTGAATRTSVYGTEHLIITKGDCGDTEGTRMYPLYNTYQAATRIFKDNVELTRLELEAISDYSEFDREFEVRHEKEDNDEVKVYKKLSERVVGKFALEDIKDENGIIIIKSGMPIMKPLEIIDKLYSETGLLVRTPSTCKEPLGICSKCYGYNYGVDRFAKIGDGIGIIAAQTIGEPGTQLTMRTFHTGGVAKDNGITQGFDAVRALLENKSYPESINEMIRYIKTFDIKDTEQSLDSTENLVRYMEKNKGTMKNVKFDSYGVVMGDYYAELQGLLKEKLQLAYLTQGIDLKDTHYEVLARAMTTEFKVIEQGSSVHSSSSIITWQEVEAINTELLKRQEKPMLVIPTVQSLKNVGMGTKSPLTAMTFRDINKTSTQALMIQGTDDLTNTMISVALSNKMATGEGARDHINRKKLRFEKVQTKRELMEELGLEVDFEKIEGIQEEVKRPKTPKAKPKKVSSVIETFMKAEDRELEFNTEIDQIETIIEQPKQPEVDLTGLDWGNEQEEIEPMMSEDILEEIEPIEENDTSTETDDEDSNLMNIGWD